jgi:hypothetical protein
MSHVHNNLCSNHMSLSVPVTQMSEHYTDVGLNLDDEG